MRFMVLVKADAKSEAGVLPSADLVVAMGRFNEEMANAGILLAAEGLQASAKGARLRFDGAKVAVTDGPFPAPTSLVSGFWMIEVASKADAIAWMSRCPFADGEEIELRQVFEAADFGDEVFPPEEVAREQALRDELARRCARA
jgi:hypothetical protein